MEENNRFTMIEASSVVVVEETSAAVVKVTSVGTIEASSNTANSVPTNIRIFSENLVIFNSLAQALKRMDNCPECIEFERQKVLNTAAVYYHMAFKACMKTITDLMTHMESFTALSLDQFGIYIDEIVKNSASCVESSEFVKKLHLGLIEDADHMRNECQDKEKTLELEKTRVEDRRKNAESDATKAEGNANIAGAVTKLFGALAVATAAVSLPVATVLVPITVAAHFIDKNYLKKMAEAQARKTAALVEKGDVELALNILGGSIMSSIELFSMTMIAMSKSINTIHAITKSFDDKLYKTDNGTKNMGMYFAMMQNPAREIIEWGRHLQGIAPLVEQNLLFLNDTGGDTKEIAQAWLAEKGLVAEYNKFMILDKKY